MVKTFPTARPEETVAEVERLLLKRTKEFETINYIYITDAENHLLGAISIKELFRNSKEVLVGNLMETKIVTVHHGTHQQKVANLALKHNLKAIPVVDKENKLLGIIPSDVILNILNEEHSEDIMRHAGILVERGQAKGIISQSPVSYFINRIPWLAVGLLGGVAAAFIVGSFEDAIREMLTLAAFIPAVVYMADAVGAQTGTIFIRSLAVDSSLEIKKYMLREFIVGTAIALLLAVLVSAISFLFWQPAILGLILGVSFFATIITAITVALSMPWLFLKIKIDPAIASGPFATVITDILSIIIYFSVASLMLNLFGA